MFDQGKFTGIDIIIYITKVIVTNRIITNSLYSLSKFNLLDIF